MFPQFFSLLSNPFAYIDPSTGGMLFQILAVLLAGLSGILFFFSRQIKSAFARLRRSFRKDEGSETQNTVQEGDDLHKPE